MKTHKKVLSGVFIYILAIGFAVTAKAWDLGNTTISMKTFQSTRWEAKARLQARLRIPGSEKKKLVGADSVNAQVAVPAEAINEETTVKRKESPYVLVEVYNLLPIEIPANLQDHLQTTEVVNGTEITVPIPIVQRTPTSGYISINGQVTPLAINPALGRGLCGRFDASSLIGQNDIEVTVLDENGKQLFKESVTVFVF